MTASDAPLSDAECAALADVLAWDRTSPTGMYMAFEFPPALYDRTRLGQVRELLP